MLVASEHEPLVHSELDARDELLTFKNGKLYPNDRPGLGVTVDFKALTEIAAFDQPRTTNVYKRPDGSLTRW